MKTRVCTKCGEEKPETEEYFYRHKASRGGLSTVCKVCCIKNVRKWKAENPEKARERNRRYYAENSEKVKGVIKRYRAENPEKVRETKRRWQAENHEKVKEAKRRWYAKNHEKVREAIKSAQRRQIDTLLPSYLKQLIAKKYDIDSSEIGDELIEAKRREIAYYRQFKQLNHLKK